MSQEKQEADFTPEVDALYPELERSVKASDLLSVSRLLMVAVMMIRLTPDVHATDMQLLCDTILAYSKKHGQLKQAIARMVQVAMLFLKEPETKDVNAPASIYAVVGKDTLHPNDEEMKDAAEHTDAMDTDEPKKAAPESEEDERAGKEDDRITALFAHGRKTGDTGLDSEKRMQLLETLSTVTEGKVFVEVERARICRMMSDMLYEKGEVNKAADVLQDLAVETFGSLGRREKVDFILEQMRLNMERGDYHRVNMFSRKINIKFFEDEAHQDLKLHYYDLMTRAGMHDRRHLDVAKYYHQVLNTPTIRADQEKTDEALRSMVLFLILSPFDNEQSDMMSRVETMERLDSVPEYRSLLKCFTMPELMRWPGIESLYGPTLRATPIFAGSDDAEYRWSQLHARVVEHNIQVVEKYYTKIRLESLAQLLDLSVVEAEDALADLVTKRTIHARIDRPVGLVDFRPQLSDAEVLNHWSSDMDKLLRTVEKVSHLVEKEWAIHRAGLVVKANE
ncbi:proteasome regulatory particle subunit [Malassezia vespertilionis]|uniref:proteasome regulatory particle subunit n=1 Tax=Malassezia vespertilionis TaxID=2020962 RepID=UPI0024B27485|nr:proteasome regulatory particle subunit [Malassezia vespertilionis]WFD06688.1 proteasome regulatory particle subunit [Malassezia vespertilionis]